MNKASYSKVPAVAVLLTTVAFSTIRAEQLLIKWKGGPENRAAIESNNQIGSKVKRNFNALGWQLVQLPPGMSAADGLASYRRLDTVQAVEPDRPIVISPPPAASRNPAPAPTITGVSALALDASVSSGASIPNDPMFRNQWYLSKIGATNAWAVATGSTNIVVAVFDSGIDYTHPDLAPNMWRNPGETGLDARGADKATNGIDDDANGYVDDVYGVDVVRDSGDPLDQGINGFYHGHRHCRDHWRGRQ